MLRTMLRPVLDHAAPFAAGCSRWIAERPVRAALTAATARGIIGDVSAQRLEQKPELDKRRLFLYTSFCQVIVLVYDRPMYERWLPRLFPPIVAGRRCVANICKATAADCLVATTFWYFPIFYLFKDCVISQPARTPFEALRHYVDEAPEQLRICWFFWLPTTFISMGFVPTHLRVSFISVAAIGWIGILSSVTEHLDQMRKRASYAESFSTSCHEHNSDETVTVPLDESSGANKLPRNDDEASR